LSKTSLSSIPLHGSREIIIISSALSTIDGDDIFVTIKSLKDHKIRCNVISLSAELHILSLLCQITSGHFNVALNEQHFKDVLLSMVTPQPVDNIHYKIGRKWILMGFPTLTLQHFPSLCCCHGEYTYSGYHCPRCNGRQCELPTDCHVCGLSLILSPHLVRSYHHLFPISQFLEINFNESNKMQKCFGCNFAIDSSKELIEKCPKCYNLFCIECNIFIHESLHNCPGCMSNV